MCMEHFQHFQHFQPDRKPNECARTKLQSKMMLFACVCSVFSNSDYRDSNGDLYSNNSATNYDATDEPSALVGH